MAGPTVAVSITKSTVWRERAELFDNVYYFDGPAFQAGDANYERLVERIVAAEKLVHGTNVTFEQARIWSAGGTVLQNVTLGLIDLSGTGSLGALAIYKESAVLVEWECSRANILGRKVYLRKYIRPCAVNSQVSTATILTGETAINASMAAPFKTYADTVDQIEITAGPTFNLVSPSGRETKAANNGVVNPYMGSREFRRN